MKNTPPRISGDNYSSPAKERCRNYGIDLLRMVSMYFVCILHMLGHGGILQSDTGGSVRHAIVWFFEIAAYCAVDCFALISGYVGCRTSFKPRNIFRLWMQAVFYSFGISVLFKIAAPESIEFLVLAKSLFPICTGAYWYLTAYALVFFLTPQMNFLLERQPVEQLRRLIWIYFGIFSMLAIMPLLDKIASPVSFGASAIWLAYLYMVGGFINRHGAIKLLPDIPLIQTRIGNVLSRPSCMFLAYMACVCATFLLSRGSHHLLIHTLGCAPGCMRLVSYNSPTILFAAIFLLLGFSQLDVSRFSPFIRIASPLAFSVYLIHDGEIIRTHLFRGAFVWILNLPIYCLPLAIMLIPLAIYIVCSIIDYMRFRLFKCLGLV